MGIPAIGDDRPIPPVALPRSCADSGTATHTARIMERVNMYEAEGVASSNIYLRMLACTQAELMRCCIGLGERALKKFEERPSDEDTLNDVKSFLAGARRVRKFAYLNITIDSRSRYQYGKPADSIDDKPVATSASDHTVKKVK